MRSKPGFKTGTKKMPDTVIRDSKFAATMKATIRPETIPVDHSMVFLSYWAEKEMCGNLPQVRRGNQETKVRKT